MPSDSGNEAPWQLDAVELAGRIRTGRLTARAVTESALEPAARGEPLNQRDRADDGRRGAGGGRRGRPRPPPRRRRRSAARGARDDQDQHRPARASHRQRRGGVSRPDADRRQRGGRPAAGRRRDLRRAHQRAAVLDALVYEQRPARPHAEPVGQRGDARGIERWRRRGGGDRDQPDQPGQRYRRFGSLSGVRERDRRAAPEHRADRLDEHDHAAGTLARRRPVGDAGAADANRARLPACPPGDGRPRHA